MTASISRDCNNVSQRTVLLIAYSWDVLLTPLQSWLCLFTVCVVPRRGTALVCGSLTWLPAQGSSHDSSLCVPAACFTTFSLFCTCLPRTTMQSSFGRRTLQQQRLLGNLHKIAYSPYFFSYPPIGLCMRIRLITRSITPLRMKLLALYISFRTFYGSTCRITCLITKNSGRRSGYLCDWRCRPSPPLTLWRGLPMFSKV